MVKKLGFSLPLILALTACGGSSNDNNSSTSGTNGGNQNGNIQCNKGIPSGMAPLGKGLFEQPLYGLTTEYYFDGSSPHGTTILDEEIFQLNKNVQYISTSSISHPTYEIDSGEDRFEYLLNSQGLFTTRQIAQSNLGWPVNYVTKMSDSEISLNQVNDQCNLSIRAADYKIEKIDLSGQPLSVLFDIEKQTVETHSNTTYTTTTYKYVDNSVAKFLNPSSFDSSEGAKQRQLNFNNMIAANTKLPAGSYIYLMTETKLHDTAYAFSEGPTPYATFEDWAKNTYRTPKNWKTLDVAGYPVYQSFKDDGGIDCATDPAILKDGKIYDGECQSTNKTAEELKSERTFYMNQTTRDALRAQLKQFYNY